MRKRILAMTLILIMLLSHFSFAANAGVMTYERNLNNTTKPTLITDNTYIDGKYSAKSNPNTASSIGITKLNGTAFTCTGNDTEIPYSSNQNKYYLRCIPEDSDNDGNYEIDKLYFVIQIEEGNAKYENIASFLYPNGLTYNNKTYNVRLNILEVNKSGSSTRELRVRLGVRTHSDNDKFNFSTYTGNVYPSVGANKKTVDDQKIEIKMEYIILDPQTNQEVQVSGLFEMLDIDLCQGIFVGGFTANANNTFRLKSDSNIRYTGVSNGTYVYSISDANTIEDHAYITLDSKSKIPVTYTFESLGAETDLRFTDSNVIKRYHKITTKATNGTITKDNTGAKGTSGAITQIKENEAKTVTYTPNEGYYLTNIKVDGADKPITDSNKTSYVFPASGSNQDHTIEVTYAAKPKVTVNTKIDNGTTKADGTGAGTNATDTTTNTVDMGGSYAGKYSFKPKAGYSVVKIMVDSLEVQPTGSADSNGVYTYNIPQDINITKDIVHNVVITTAPNVSSVIAKYVDEEGNVLAKEQTQEGNVDANYKTTAKDIPNYELISMPANAEGKFAADPITVTYVYRLKATKVITKYIDADTKEKIVEDVEKDGKVTEDYTTEEKKFDGYKLVAKPTNATGKMTEEPIEVIYYYTRNAAPVVANYVDEDGKQIAPSETETGKIGEDYKTEKKDIKGYELTKVPDNAEGKFEEDTVVVNYVYKLKPAKVIVKYVDKQKIEIADETIIDGKFFDKYDTNGKAIPGYDLVTVPENATGTMDEETTTVTYIYDKKSTSVIVNYLDENGKELVNPVKIDGKVGNSYTTEKKTIPGYELKTTPANATGTMTEDAIVVNYIYKPVKTVTELPKTGNTSIVVMSIAAVVVFGGLMLGILRSDKYKSIK